MPKRSSKGKTARADEDDVVLTDAELATLAPMSEDHPVRRAIEEARAESRKRPGTSRDHDFTAIARNVVEQAIGERLDGSPLPVETKNPHAVALGKLGGKKGGKARAAKLSPAKRKAIAKAAAKARWG